VYQTGMFIPTVHFSKSLLGIMKLYSTNNPGKFYSLGEAVLQGLPSDNGLFMPAMIPALDPTFFQNIEELSFQDIAYTVAKNLIGDEIPPDILKEMVNQSINFPAPLVQLDEHLFVLELFHGPTLAFKDFGARFMAQLMSHFNKDKNKELVILVATSGDTGGAVASGFYDIPGIKVIILYPSKKVSKLQEKQLTTLGKNITALEIEGTFDDCQALVKKAFLDRDLKSQIQLTSANSINIARLIPQSFYYFEAFKQLPDKKEPFVFIVPSGNFGNLTAGLLAKRMGLPVKEFVAATNENDVVPAFLESGNYLPRQSVATLSNAMDVGDPSNFARMMDLYGSTWNNFTGEIKGYKVTDPETLEEIHRIKSRYNYQIDPHGAVGTAAFIRYHQKNSQTRGIVLETAHPAKFAEEVSKHTKMDIVIPNQLKQLLDLEKTSVVLPTDFNSLKNWLLQNLR
jgi:threonine synthase